MVFVVSVRPYAIAGPSLTVKRFTVYRVGGAPPACFGLSTSGGEREESSVHQSRWVLVIVGLTTACNRTCSTTPMNRGAGARPLLVGI